jgi:hypothetical protein
MGMYVLSGTQASSISPLPHSFIYFYLNKHECRSYVSFLFISGGWRALCNHIEDFGVMTMYVYNPQRWATITDFRGMTFERAQDGKDSYRFELVCKWYEGFGMDLWQAEHKSCLVLCFQNKNFQDFEFGTCTMSCHHIAKINKQDGERS